MAFRRYSKGITDVSQSPYPICKYTDMTDEMKMQTIDICTTAMEKHRDNFEQAARLIKLQMDKQFGPPFQVVIGETYGCDVTHQENSLLHFHIDKKISATIWRTVVLFL